MTVIYVLQQYVFYIYTLFMVYSWGESYSHGQLVCSPDELKIGDKVKGHGEFESLGYGVGKLERKNEFYIFFILYIIFNE